MIDFPTLRISYLSCLWYVRGERIWQGRKKLTSVLRFNDISKMNEVVVKEAGCVESVKAVCAGYERRIKSFRDWLNKAIVNENFDELDDVEKREFKDSFASQAYGILTELQDDTRLPPKKQAALIRKLRKISPAYYAGLPAGVDSVDYGYDPIVALYVASRYSMRKIADELGIDVSTVSHHVRKWAEQNAELRGPLETTREVELARLDEMLEGLYAPTVQEKLQILDRKYRLMGLYASSPQVVVGIGVQQGQQGGSQPRVIEGVARDISDETV